MSHPLRVVFVAPYILDATLRFVRAVASLPDIQFGLVSSDPLEALPADVRARISGHYRIDDCLNAGQLAAGVRGVASQLAGGGPMTIDRLLGTLEHLQIPLGEVRDHLGIDGMGEAAARNFRDKARMKDVLRAAGLPCARHRAVESGEAAAAFIREIGLPVVVKPPDGAAAAGTYRVTSEAELHRALAALRPGPGQPIVIEQLVVGRECSLETVSVRGRAVWDSHTRYDPEPLRVLENPWIQWTVLLPREVDDGDTAAIRAPARAALEALGMHTGLSHMEWFHTDRGPAISEVGARPPGAQIIPLNGYAHDVDFHQKWARLVVFDEWTPPERKYAAGAAFFRGQARPATGRTAGEASGRIAKLHGLDRAQAEIGHLVVEANLPVLGASKRKSYEGDGFAILRHRDTAVVADALRRLVSLVQVEVA